MPLLTPALLQAQGGKDEKISITRLTFGQVHLGAPKEATLEQLKLTYDLSRDNDDFDLWTVTTKDHGLVGHIVFSNSMVAAIRNTQMITEDSETAELVRKLYTDFRLR